MQFLPVLGPVLLTCLLLWGTGGFLSWAVGLRGLWAFASAPAFAVTMIAGTAVAASWLHVAWSVVPVLIVTAVVGGAFVLLRRAFPDGRSLPKRMLTISEAVPIAAVVTVAAAVMVARVAQIVHAPSNISQTFDNIFHLNGVRFILRGGDASSLNLGHMTSPDGSLPFYPAAWHDLVSLVVQLSGTSIPVAVNAVVITVSAAVWPLAVVLLVRTLFGRQLAFTVGAALLAVSIPAFPILLMDYGVLYPLQLSLALLPVAIAAAARAFGIVRDAPPTGTAWWAIICAGSLVGITIAHPGGFVAWLALTFPIVLLRLVLSFRAARSWWYRAILLGITVGYLLVGRVLIKLLRPPLEARQWPTQMSISRAIEQIATVSVWYLTPAVIAAVCILAGVVWALVDRKPRPLIAAAMYGIAAGLFVVVAALQLPNLRDLLTGSWYNNLPRLAAILGVMMVPIGAYGVGRSWIAISGWVRRFRIVETTRARAVVVTVGGSAAAAALLVGLQVDGAMTRAADWAGTAYRLDDDSPLLTEDEYALLDRLPGEVPYDAVVAGSPWTGTSLAFAISDRRVLMPHTLMYVSDEITEINNGLDEARRGDAVCAAISDLGVSYVLDFGHREVHQEDHSFPGLDRLATSSSVQLVDRQGEAALYRVTACE